MTEVHLRDALRWLGMERSMRRFILVAVALVLGVLTLLDAGIEYRQASSHAAEQRDRALGRVASGYVRALRAQDADASRIPTSVFQEETGLSEAPRLRFRVSSEAGEWRGGDRELPLGMDAARRASSTQPDFLDVRIADEPWRVAMVKEDPLLVRAQAQPVLVQVAEPMKGRLRAQRELLLAIGAGKSTRLAIVLALMWIVIWFGLAPLQALQRELKRRRPEDLSLVSQERPEELVPLVHTLNELLAAQRESVEQQKKFLADASHQLRTPIAVLRTMVQGAIHGQTAPDETLPKMLGIIDRATGLTNQLLSMAKAEQLARRRDWAPVRLDVVARDVAMELAPLIAKKRLDFSLQATPATLSADRWMLAELLKNLVSNAVHHSRKRGALGIVIRRLRQEVELIVWDHGGGVDEQVLDRLFEPFNVAKTGTGIGLGLSICRQIAEALNASVDLFNRIEAGEVVGVDAVVRWPHAQQREEEDSEEGGGPTPAERGVHA
jgi:signal transduction histidine kinase